MEDPRLNALVRDRNRVKTRSLVCKSTTLNLYEGDFIVDSGESTRVLVGVACDGDRVAPLLMRGLANQARVAHPAVQSIIAICPEQRSGSRTVAPLTVTFPYSRYNLEGILRDERTNAAPIKWNATQKSKCILGIAAGMAHIHSLGVIYTRGKVHLHEMIHRNLKPKSIRLTSELEPQIGGFDWSRMRSPDMTMRLGSPLFIAPEMARRKGAYTEKVDVYAFAVTVYTMFKDGRTFEGSIGETTTAKQILYAVLKGKRLEKVSEIPNKYWELIQMCWRQRPEERPYFKGIVQEIMGHLEEYALPGTDMDEYRRYGESLIDGVVPTNLGNHMRDLSEFRVIEEIARGGQGVVEKVEDLILGKEFAWKRGVNGDEATRESMMREIEILIKLDHPCVLPIRAVVPGADSSAAIIVTELAVNGSLRDVLRKLPDLPGSRSIHTNLAKIVAGVALGMRYIHGRNVIHRDFKPGNILIDGKYRPMIGDFGCGCVDLGPLESLYVTGHIVPEVVLNMDRGAKSEITNKVDVFAFGLTLYEIVFGKHAFSGDTLAIAEDYRNRYRPSVDVDMCSRATGVNDVVLSMIKKCWADDPDMRPTFAEIVDSLKRIDYKIFSDCLEEPLESYVRYIESFEKYSEEIVKDVLHHGEGELDRLTDIIRDRSDFSSDELIGKGAYGRVWSCYDEKLEYRVARKDMCIDSESSDPVLSRFLFETGLLMKADHPCVVHVIGVVLPICGRDEAGIVTELMETKSVDSLVAVGSARRPEFTHTTAAIIVVGTAFGMRWVHNQNIIHRDLKPMNILLDERHRPRIADFGCSRLDEQSQMTKGVGTPMYMAPELYQDEGGYTNSVDVYSYAITAYEIIFRKLAFCGMPVKVMKDVESGVRPELDVIGKEEGVKVEFLDLLKRCWHGDVKKRPSFTDIVDELADMDYSMFRDSDSGIVREYVNELCEFEAKRRC